MDYSKRLYDTLEPYARLIKTILQMLIGLAIGLYLIVFVFQFAINIKDANWVISEDFAPQLPLAVVGYGLAVSAGVELAYMLFTKGPDEAIDPLILGLSATALIILPKIEVISWQAALIIPAIVGSIAGLFWIRSKLLNDDCLLYTSPSPRD